MKVLRENVYFRVDETQSPDVRVYHSRLELLSTHGVQGLTRNMVASDLPFEPSPVLLIVLGIPGVTAAELRAYQLTVQKSPVYSWDEIEAPLFDLWYGIQPAVNLA